MSAVVRLTWDDGEYGRMMHSSTGEVATFLITLGVQVAVTARSLAPVSADGSYGRPRGYLRDHITHVLSTESGLHCDVISPATTPDGFPYGFGMEVGTRPHTITSHGDYPLRAHDGRALGHSVQHPGTKAHPYLRPALETVRNIAR
jgi:hypothetical protein